MGGQPGCLAFAREYRQGGFLRYSTPSNAVLLPHFFQSYLYLVNQDRSAWTWELDRKPRFVNFSARLKIDAVALVRPAHEKW